MVPTSKWDDFIKTVRIAGYTAFIFVASLAINLVLGLVLAVTDAYENAYETWQDGWSIDAPTENGDGEDYE